MTDEEIHRARQIIELATATPITWSIDPDGALLISTRDRPDRFAAFLLAAAAGWREALDEVERLKAEVDVRDGALRQENERLREMVESLRTLSDQLTASLSER